jgi:hypothetical protein
MNCHELKSYFENISLMSADPSAESRMAEHIAGCPKCARFMEAQKELRTSLSLLRESVSSPTSNLDEMVLANYRKHVAGLRTSSETATLRKRVLTTSLRWSLGLAAAMALAAVLLWPRRPTGETNRPLTAPPAISSVRLNASAQGPAPQKPRGEKRRNGVIKRTQPAVSAASMSNPVPEGFRSLMYCDELSCGGAMDVVRIQLQPSEPGVMAAAQQSSNVVSADVLVGADGVARGIRIVR